MRISFAFLLLCLTQTRADLVFMHETEGEKRIWLQNETGLKPLTQTGKWCLYPDIDSTGERVAYVCGIEKSTEVVVRELKGNQEEVISPANGLQLHPDFSGDGRFLAYTSPVQGTSQIVIYNLKEKSRSVMRDGTASYFPALSSDGTFVVYQRTRGSKDKELVLADVATQKTKVLATGFSVSMAPALSFDDRYVAFTASQNGVWDVNVLDLSTGAVKKVTRGEGRNFAPTFTPEGDILFASDRSGHFAFYRVENEKWQQEASSGEVYLSLEGDIYAPSVSGNKRLTSMILPDIPAPGRSSFGAIRVKDRIYVIGGHQGPEHTYPENSFLNRVDILDLKTGAWSRGSGRSQPSHGFGLASFGKYIYAFGGFAFASPDQVFTPKWRSLDTIERYDTQTDRWETIGKMSRRRSSYVVATVGQKAYLIGGWDSTPRFDKDYDGVFHRKVDIFDFVMEKITEATFELPNPLRRAFSGIVRGEEIFLVGGLGQGATHFELLDNVTALNPVTGTFRELAKLPFATFAPAVGVLNDKLLVFGGMFKFSPQEYAYVNHVFEYEMGPALKKSWAHSGRFMREAKGFAQVVESDEGLIVLGGHAYFGDVDTPVSSVDLWSFSSSSRALPPSILETKKHIFQDIGSPQQSNGFSPSQPFSWPGRKVRESQPWLHPR